jgi:hypothetical protein
VIARTGFYIEVEVRSSKPRCKSIPLVIVVVVSIAVAALKIGDVLTYSLVPFFLYMVYRPISRFTAYKALFALITVLTIRGVILLVRGVVLLVSIE